MNIKYKHKQSRNKKGWHIGLNRGFLGWGGVLFTVLFSLTGAYAFGVPFFTENGELVEVEKFLAILGGVGLILVTFEYLRGKSWAGWMNSRLDELISSFLPTGSDVKRMTKKYRHLFFAIFLTLGLFSGDVFGAWSLKNIINNKFISWHMENNKEYQGELVKLKNRTKTYLSDKEFSLELSRLKQEASQRRQCNKQFPLPKWKTKNGECFNRWLAEHKQSKLNTLGVLETDGLIADSFPKAYAEAVDFAKPYQWFMFCLFLFVAVMAHYLANRDSNEAYGEQKEAIEQFPDLFVTDLEHFRECERTEKSELSSISRESNEKMMYLNIDTKRDIEDVKLDGYAEVKKIELQAVQNNTEDFKRLVNNNFIKAEEKRGRVVNEPSSTTIAPKKTVGNDRVVDGQIVATTTDTDTVAEKPIGFRVGEEAVDQKPVQPNPPVFTESKKSGYFDDGYDLALAIWCLFEEGNREAGDELLTNKQLYSAYNNHPAKKNELIYNQISKVVKNPLKSQALIKTKIGFADRAKYSVDVVMEELGLLHYWAEITRDAKPKPQISPLPSPESLITFSEEAWRELLQHVSKGSVMTMFGQISHIEYKKNCLFIQKPRSQEYIQFIVEHHGQKEYCDTLEDAVALYNSNVGD